jgi:hypothetical protein
MNGQGVETVGRERGMGREWGSPTFLSFFHFKSARVREPRSVGVPDSRLGGSHRKACIA